MPSERNSSASREECIRLLRALPDLEPDPDFLERLMRRLPERHPTPLMRLRLWATRPLRLTLTPLRLAPVLGLLLAALIVLPLFPRSAPHDAPSPGSPDAVGVRFVLHDQHRALHSVAVLGSFNEWRPGGFEMRYDDRARAWTLSAHLPRGSHEYVFLVDGERTEPDPQAAFFKDDGFGRRNSVLLLENGHAL